MTTWLFLNNRYNSVDLRQKLRMNQKTIIEDIKDQIISGALTPGEHLKGRTLYEKHYKTTTNTVQHAFTRLAEDGFIESFPRKGTYISKNPPHLKNYALLIYSDQIPEGWGAGNNYWKTLDRVCTELNQEGDRNINIRTGISPDYNTREYRNLLDDISARRLAGVISSMSIDLLKGTPVLETKNLPVISLADHNSPRIPKIVMDGAQFYKRAFEDLIKRGRKRIAIICPPAVHERLPQFIGNIAREVGIDLNPLWLQTVDQKHPGSAENLVQLLMKGNANERPDGLILTDDNFIEHACRGLIKTGLHLIEDIDVVAHANFPLEKADILPIRRLGYDIAHSLTTAMDEIDAIRRGEEVPAKTLIAPKFDTFKAEASSEFLNDSWQTEVAGPQSTAQAVNSVHPAMDT